jgi:hypothetical protein
MHLNWNDYKKEILLMLIRYVVSTKEANKS